jgi:hypothetical protein
LTSDKCIALLRFFLSWLRSCAWRFLHFHFISFDLRRHLESGRRGSLRRALTFNFLDSSHKLGLTLLPTSAIIAHRVLSENPPAAH